MRYMTLEPLITAPLRAREFYWLRVPAVPVGVAEGIHRVDYACRQLGPVPRPGRWSCSCRAGVLRVLLSRKTFTAWPSLADLQTAAVLRSELHELINYKTIVVRDWPVSSPAPSCREIPAVLPSGRFRGSSVLQPADRWRVHQRQLPQRNSQRPHGVSPCMTLPGHH